MSQSSPIEEAFVKIATGMLMRDLERLISLVGEPNEFQLALHKVFITQTTAFFAALADSARLEEYLSALVRDIKGMVAKMPTKEEVLRGLERDLN